MKKKDKQLSILDSVEQTETSGTKQKKYGLKELSIKLRNEAYNKKKETTANFIV